MNRLAHRRKLGIALIALAILVGVALRITVGRLYYIHLVSSSTIVEQNGATATTKVFETSPSSPWLWLALASLTAGVLCVCLPTVQQNKN